MFKIFIMKLNFLILFCLITINLFSQEKTKVSKAVTIAPQTSISQEYNTVITKMSATPNYTITIKSTKKEINYFNPENNTLLSTMTLSAPDAVMVFVEKLNQKNNINILTNTVVTKMQLKPMEENIILKQ